MNKIYLTPRSAVIASLVCAWLWQVGVTGYAQLGERKPGGSLSKNRIKNGLSDGANKRLEKFNEANGGALSDPSRQGSGVYQPPGSVKYKDLYHAHVENRYGLVDGKPVPLNYQVSGMVEAIPDDRTLILTKCQVRFIDLARVEKRLGVFEQTSGGVFPDKRTLAVQVDDARTFQVGKRFLDPKKRRLADGGSIDYETRDWGVRKVKCFRTVPPVTYPEFVKLNEAGHRFAPKTDWETWAEEHGKF